MPSRVLHHDRGVLVAAALDENKSAKDHEHRGPLHAGDGEAPVERLKVRVDILRCERLADGLYSVTEHEQRRSLLSWRRVINGCPRRQCGCVGCAPVAHGGGGAGGSVDRGDEKHRLAHEALFMRTLEEAAEIQPAMMSTKARPPAHRAHRGASAAARRASRCCAR